MRKLLVSILVVTALVVGTGPYAYGAKGGIPGPPSGGEEGAKNLSVPALFVPDTGTFAVTCGVPIDPPTGDPLTGYPIDPTAYYYVQGVHQWQAECLEYDPAVEGALHVTAAWGDNLAGGSASLKAGSPIRVEMALSAVLPEGETMQGYLVEKLNNDALDRVAPYGTLAEGSPLAAVPETFPGTFQVWDAEEGTFVDKTIGVRVWDGTAYLTIVRDDGMEVYDGPMSAEINSTGSIVFGYNWGSGTGRANKTVAGDYTITFTVDNVLIDSVNGLDNGAALVDAHTVTFDVTVASSAGGGPKNPVS